MRGLLFYRNLVIFTPFTLINFLAGHIRPPTEHAETRSSDCEPTTKCQVCNTIIPIANKEKQLVVKCPSCREATVGVPRYILHYFHSLLKVRQRANNTFVASVNAC